MEGSFDGSKLPAPPVFIATTVGALHPLQVNSALVGPHVFEQTGHFNEYLSAVFIVLRPWGASDITLDQLLDHRGR
jgi:hypothetical protein